MESAGDLTARQAQMVETLREVERLRAVEGELVAAKQELATVRTVGEELPSVLEELAELKGSLLMLAVRERSSSKFALN